MPVIMQSRQIKPQAKKHPQDGTCQTFLYLMALLYFRAFFYFQAFFYLRHFTIYLPPAG
jgi:hypothetical protein